jgi:hypothetical protein
MGSVEPRRVMASILYPEAGDCISNIFPVFFCHELYHSAAHLRFNWARHASPAGVRRRLIIDQYAIALLKVLQMKVSPL